VINEELRSPSEEISEGRFPFIDLEAVLLLDTNPRQFLPLSGKLVAAPRQLLLGFEQLDPGCGPFLARHNLVRSGQCVVFNFGHNIFLCLRVAVFRQVQSDFRDERPVAQRLSLRTARTLPLLAPPQ